MMPVWTHYLAAFVVAGIATIGFGITFQMPRRHYLACGLTGAVGWMVYIFGVELFSMSPAVATLVATLPLTIPAIVLVVGLGPIYRWLSADVLSTNPIWLCFVYVITPPTISCRARRSFSPARAPKPSRLRWRWRSALRWSAACPCRETTSPKSSPMPRSAKDGVFFCVKILFFARQTSII